MSYIQAAKQIPGTSLQLGCLESPLEQLTASVALGSGCKSCKLQLSLTCEAYLPPDFQSLLSPSWNKCFNLKTTALQLSSRTATRVADSV